MLPPQAPPAHVAHASQSAFDRLQRMQDIQAWLAEQQDDIPALPSRLDGRDTFLIAFDAFWENTLTSASAQPPMSRREALALRLAQAMRDDASLRRGDGTLRDADTALVTDVALHTAGPLHPHSKAWELLFGGIPYAGALVVQDDRDAGRVLLFTVEAGWQAFDSLAILYRDVELDLRAQLARRGELPGIGLDDSEPALATHFLATQAIDAGHVAGTVTRRLLARLRERVVNAFDLAATDAELQDRLHDALNLHALLDTHAIVRQRDLALTAQLETERLNALPAPVREHWQRTASEYRDSWRMDADSVAATLPSLGTFAEAELGEALRKHGIDAPPHELYVRLTRVVAHQPVATLISGFPTEDLSLLELAYRNVGNFATERLQVVYADGSARDDVPAETLRTIVRSLDLPNAYARHLEETFRDSPEGRRRRETSGRLLRARMRFEAADARISYYDPTEPASFVRGDPLYHGFHWVQAVLDHPSPGQRARVDGHEIAVYQFTYKGAPLAGVFLFGPRQKNSGDSIVLYTPGAPDGRTFRQMSRRDLKSDIFLKKIFEPYLLDRLPGDVAEVDSYGRRRFKVLRLNDDRPASWVFNFGGSGCVGCTELAEDFQEREVTGSFLDAAYDTVVDLARRNAENLASSTSSADWNGGVDAVSGWNLAFNVVQEFVVGAVKGTLNTAQASWRAYDHIKAGENTAAFLAFVEGYTSGITSVLPLYSQVPRVVGASVRAAGSRALVSRHRALPAPETLFEKQYLARDVTLAGQPSASGVHTVAGQHFIEHGGKSYRVRWDASFDTWRLAREHATNASNTGPAIRRLADGQWARSRVGLRGGVGDERFAEAFLLANTLLDDTRLSPELRALTQYQRSVVAATVRTRLPFGETLQVLQRKSGTVSGALSPAQQAAWEHSLAVGRQAMPPPPRPNPNPLLSSALAGPSQPAPHLPALDLTTPPPQRIPPIVDLTTSPSRTPPLVDLATPPPRTPPAPVGASATVAKPTSSPPGGSSSRLQPLVTTEAGVYAFAPPRDLNPLIPRREWPEAVYVYLNPGRLPQAGRRGTLTLEQRVADGLSLGVPVTTLPPTTLMSDVPPALFPFLPRATSAESTLGAMSGGWVRIEMRNLPTNPPSPIPNPRFEHHFRRFELQHSNVTMGYYLRTVKALPYDPKGFFSRGPLVLPGSTYTIGTPH